MNNPDMYDDAKSSHRMSSEPRLPHEKKHSRNVSMELSTVDWDANVVNFISNFIHPGIYRRKSYQFQPGPYGYSSTLPHKTHRRIASASTNFTPNPVFKTNKYDRKGHSRNISDPGKIFYFLPDTCNVMDIPEESGINYSPVSLAPPSDKVDGDKDAYKSTLRSYEPPVKVVKGDDFNYCRFGCFSIRAFPKLITSILSLMVLFQSVVVSGYMSSMFTTIERRFDLKNSQTGYIVSAYEVGAVLSIILVSLFHSQKKSRPRIIAFSGILMTIGFILFTAPHYFSGSYDPVSRNTSSCSSLTISGIKINTDYSIALPIFLISQFLAGLGASPIYVLAPTYLWDNLPEVKYPIYSACFYCCAAVGPALGYIFASVFLRIYIDHPSEPVYLTEDKVRVEMKPGDDKFLGAWWIGMLINSGLIFLTTLPAFSFPAQFAKIQEEHGEIEPNKQTDMAQTGDRQKLPDPNNNDVEVKNIGEQYPDVFTEKQKHFYEENTPNEDNRKPFYKLSGRKLKPILEGKPKFRQILDDLIEKFKNIKKICLVIFTNYIWLGVTVVNVFENSIVSAFVTYAAKYIETMFRISPHLAAITTGGVVIPSALLGVICGALMMQRFRPTVQNVLKWMHLTMLLSLMTNLGLILLGCEENQIAGVTATYDGKPWPYDTFPSNPFPKNLTADCNLGCSKSIDFEPVCWNSSVDNRKMTYYSSCHAGCSQENGRYNLDNCKCMGGQYLGSANRTLPEVSSVKAGMCHINCPNFYPFLILLFLHIFLTTLHQNPSNVLTLACVDSEYGSQALGLQVFFIRILAFVPAPIYFGQLIDSVCQERSTPTKTDGLSKCKKILDWNLTQSQWEEKVETLKGPMVEGVCKAYSPLGLAFMTMGGLFLLKICSLVGLIITYQITRLKYENNPENFNESSESKEDPEEIA